jgi:DNA-binding beta-propeller fold protein YncE
LAVSPDGKSVYAANLESTVSQYDVDPASGALSPKTPATVASGSSGGLPIGVAVTPDGKSAYVTNANESTVSQYDVDPVTGALSPKSPATVATRPGPDGIAVTPDGRSAYVPEFFENTVSQYDIDPITGALSAKTPDAVRAGLGSTGGIAITPDSKSAYLTSVFDSTLWQYDIDPATGNLSPKTPASFIDGAPIGIAVTPDGKSAYVPSAQYDIDPLTGALTPKTPLFFPVAGHSLLDVALTSDGGSAYVSGFGAGGEGAVLQYDIQPQTGVLSPKTPATVATGAALAIAVGPLPRVPTSKVQCKNGGWRSFPQFKNEGLCIAFVNLAP